jgi:methyl-accepting chemotaxis protein
MVTFRFNTREGDMTATALTGPTSAPGRRRVFGFLLDLRVGVKVVGLVLVGVLFTLAVGLVGQMQLNSAMASARKAVDRGAIPAIQLTAARADWEQLRRSVSDIASASGLGDRLESMERVNAIRGRVSAAVSDMRFAKGSPEATELADVVVPNLAAALAAWDSQLTPLAKAEELAGDDLGEFERVRSEDFFGPAEVTKLGLTTLSEMQGKSMDSGLKQAAAAQHTGTVRIWLVTLIGAALTLTLGLLTTRALTRPLDQVRRALVALAGGDLTMRAPVSSQDEIGQMAAALEEAQDSLTKTVTAMAESAAKLSENAEELHTVAVETAQHTRGVSDMSATAALAAAEVSLSVLSTSTATEEMSTSIVEISRSSTDAVRVANLAVTEAATANATVAKLDESSQEIGSVIKLITSIAEQTNLLALNATIEAARAGDAGKGFAVVADEVKQLAQATARATEDISRRIEAIQGDSQAAAAAIALISATIEQVNDYQVTIASAVEEQTAVTDEIARSVQEAATGASRIAESIDSVASTAEQTSLGTERTTVAAQELSMVSSALRDLVVQFTLR